MNTPKPQEGTWTLTAPDGRTWLGDTPLHAAGAELRERVPPAEQMRRVMAALLPTQDELDAARYRWLRAQHWESNTIAAVRQPKDAIKLGHDAPSGERLDTLIDDAIAMTPNLVPKAEAATAPPSGGRGQVPS